MGITDWISRLDPARKGLTTLAVTVLIMVLTTATANAHPLGNFTINHFAHIEPDTEQIRIHYVVDMAEIPTFQELQATDTDGDGKPSPTELNTYLARVAPQYANGLKLTVDDIQIPLETVNKKVTTPPGAGGLLTLRVESDFLATLTRSSTMHRLRFEDTNHGDHLGWRELVVAPAAGVTVFNSTAFGNALSDELRVYPQERLAAPLDERIAELSWTTGTVPADAVALRRRDGQPVAQARDPLAELIAVQEITPGVAVFGLLVAAAIGALHAFSPGHGKTVVGAYLVGSRGTLGHAAFLGLTVTITHTAGVLGLGLVTLFASQYVVPERLFPILSFVSGGIVAVIGLSLFVRRLQVLQGKTRVNNHTHHDHTHSDHMHPAHGHNHTHPDHDHPHRHSHGGQPHSHLPPGTDGTPITWRSLLALGISGGLLPCPSALVVMLSAIALHRVGYGLLLVVAFSIGLAATLTGIGLAFLYAGGVIKRSRLGAIDHPLVRLLPVVSAFVIMCIGAVICYQAIAPAGFNLFAVEPAAAAQIGEVYSGGEPFIPYLGALVVLSLGLVFGLKQATVGHTAVLMIVGLIVLTLGARLPEGVAIELEFGVTLMSIGLGATGLVQSLGRHFNARVLRRRCFSTDLAPLERLRIRRSLVHVRQPAQLHLKPQPAPRSRRVDLKLLIAHAVNGLIGSVALTLLVLAQIQSPIVGLLYLAVFGTGAIAGRLLMSGLIVPFALSNRLQMVAGVLSIAFGIWYAYEIRVML